MLFNRIAFKHETRHIFFILRDTVVNHICVSFSHSHLKRVTFLRRLYCHKYTYTAQSRKHTLSVQFSTQEVNIYIYPWWKYPNTCHSLHLKISIHGNSTIPLILFFCLFHMYWWVAPVTRSHYCEQARQRI